MTTTTVIRRPLLAALALGLLLASGCGLVFVDSTVEEGKPLNAEKIGQIVIGQTTRSEVFRLIGAPHSMFQGDLEFQEKLVLGNFYLHTQKRKLSTLDDQHYAILYRAGKVTGQTRVGYAVLVTIGKEKATIRTDELLLILNKQTNVVEDVGYEQ